MASQVGTRALLLSLWYDTFMKKPKLELALVILAIALATFLLREPPASENLPATSLTAPKVQLSDDAKWLLTTAVDSYTPRVEVEQAWSGSEAKKP